MALPPGSGQPEDHPPRQNLREGESHGSLAQEAAGAGTWDWDIRTGELIWSRMLYDLFGLDPARDPASFEVWNRILHPEDVAVANARIEKALKEQSSLNSEYRIIRPDGETRWINALGGGLYDDDGRPVWMSGICIDISRRRAAEEALRESEMRYRTVADFTLDWEFWFDPGGKILYVSPSADQILGRPAGKFSEIVPFLGEVVHPDDLPSRLAHLNDELAGKGPSELEFRIVRADGEVRWINHICRPIHDTGGKFLGTRGSNRDITERRKTEEALRGSEEKYRIIVETANEGIWIHDAERKTILVNQRMADMLGYTVEEILGRTPSDFLTADQEPVRVKTLKDLETGVSTTREFRFRRKDGSDLWVISNASPVFDDKGRLLRTVSLLTDITDRKQAEGALRKAYDELELRVQERTAALKQAVAYNRSLIEAGLDPLVTINPAGKISDVNAATIDVTGFTRGELIGTDFSDYFTEPDKARAGYQMVFRHGFVRDYPLGIRRRDGRVIPVLYNATVFHDESGKAAGVFAAARDISALKEAEQAIMQAHSETRVERQRLYEVLETLPVYVCLLDKDYKMPFANRYFRDTFGYSLIRPCYNFLFNLNKPCENCETYKVMKTRAPHHWYWTGPNGRDYDIYDYPFTDTDGSALILEMGIDITEQKKAEAAVRKANEALERRVAERTAELAGINEELRAANEELGVAHEDLNMNILELRRSEDLLKQKATELTEALAEKEMLLSEIHHRVKNNLTAFISLLSLEGSYEETEAGNQLKKDLQNRARSMALIHETLYRTKKYSHVDMGIYLTTLVEQITTSYTTRRDVHVNVRADGVILDLARATPCGLIINELVTNSFKYAFPPGFDCASVRSEPCTICVSLQIVDDMYRLIVSDNGAGLPEGIRLASAKSLGLKLVNFLARHQLRAAILVDTSSGTSIEFQFTKDPSHV